jgi:hypothetical protein
MKDIVGTKETSVTTTESTTRDTAYEIIVNARAHRVQTAVLTYDLIVELAFPGHPTGPNVYFEVSYSNAVEPKPKATLLEGETVTVRNGTNFHVTQTDRS